MRHGFVLPMALAWVACPALAADDVTMQVLDDARDVDAVTRALRDARPAATAEGGDETSKRAPAGESSDPQAAGGDARTRTGDTLAANLDREEESEGEIEDFDIPEDLVIPGP